MIQVCSDDGLEDDVSDLESENSDTDLLDYVNIDNIPVQFEDGTVVCDIDIGEEAQTSVEVLLEQENNVVATEDSDDQTLAEIVAKKSNRKKQKTLYGKRKI
ncbi:hypothetical protein FQA39_LY06663 [Lamprigera yunnana]|nr:hypothetical protein FQA39_LY06663 [Lamprigera yunnana]